MMTTRKTRRLRILSKAEINALYGLPRFSAKEREQYFSLSSEEQAYADSRGSMASKLDFLLQLGYFKAASQFFNYHIDDISEDIDYLKLHYFDSEQCPTKKSLAVSKQTRANNQQAIVQLLGFTSNKAAIIPKLTSHLQQHIKLNGDPTYLFHTVLHYCEQE